MTHPQSGIILISDSDQIMGITKYVSISFLSTSKLPKSLRERERMMYYW